MIWIVIVSVVLFVLIRTFLKFDCDLTLWYYENYGKPISDLKGKVVWITGASSGIGEHVAYQFAAVGARLVLSGTNEERLKKVKENCLQKGLNQRDVLILAFNITDTSAHKANLDAVLKHFSKLDILVNNAGRSLRAKFSEMDIEVDRDIFNVNVFGTINLTRLVLNYFLNNSVKGHFVVTSSVSGKFGPAFMSGYAATKHALHGYFESIRNEYSTKDIKVTMICPGPVFSRISENSFTAKAGEKLGLQIGDTAKRMPTERCAQLIGVATSNSLAECWISPHPVLIMYYLYQYIPTISRFLFPKIITPERSQRIRDGQ